VGLSRAVCLIGDDSWIEVRIWNDGIPDQVVEYDLPAELIDRSWLHQPWAENASEHDRNSVFHWWLRKSPSKDLLDEAG
jgi:hypothetical protein